MFGFLRRLTRIFVRKSTLISQEPLNKVSLIILILIDCFVLFNVFSGLESISHWPLSPNEAYPCWGEYETYRRDLDNPQLKADEVRFGVVDAAVQPLEPWQTNPTIDGNRLGEINPICLQYSQLRQGLQTPETKAIRDRIENLKAQANNHQKAIDQLKAEYDSTLLEEIAGQDPNQSINAATAATTKTKIAQHESEITKAHSQIKAQKAQLMATPGAIAYLQQLDNPSDYQTLKTSYENAEFWYPNFQFGLQLLFLAPLILLTYGWHGQAIRRNWGLQTLLSWHLLLIFSIPVAVRLFQFLQFGNLVRLVVDTIVALVGGLLFVASYIFILVVPLVGFGLIKFLQHFVFNPRVQAKKRIQKHRCIQCNARLRTDDPHCPHCGFNQYQECGHCHQPTYQYAPFCRVCGTATEAPEPKS
jgi:hypothetical protein